MPLKEFLEPMKCKNMRDLHGEAPRGLFSLAPTIGRDITVKKAIEFREGFKNV